MNFGLVLNRIREVLMAVFSNGESLAKIKRRLDDIEHRQIQQGDAITRIESVQHDQSQLLNILNRVVANLGVKIAGFDEKLDKILTAVILPPVAVRFVVTVSDLDGGNPQTVQEGNKMEVKVGKKKLATIEKAVDQFGNVAKVDGAPTWGSAGDAVESVVAAADGLSAVITLGKVAEVSGQVTLTGDGDPGPDQALFHSTLDFTTIADNAVEFVVSVTDAP